MSTRDNDGGPAFPVSVGMGPLSAQFASPGMSLRDWFAGMALQGMFSIKITPDSRPIAEGFAIQAYQFADSMIAERNKTS
jgi:hypothetical protein